MNTALAQLFTITDTLRSIETTLIVANVLLGAIVVVLVWRNW